MVIWLSSDTDTVVGCIWLAGTHINLHVCVCSGFPGALKEVDKLEDISEKMLRESERKPTYLSRLLSHCICQDGKRE